MQVPAKTILNVIFWLYLGLFYWGWLREWLHPVLALIAMVLCLMRILIVWRHKSGRLELAAGIAGLLLHIQYCIAQPLQIKGVSMEPTLHPGQIVWVNKLSAGLILPPIIPTLGSTGYHRLASGAIIQKNSIIVIRFPGLDEGADVILAKRVVALAGEPFEFRDSKLFVNNVPCFSHGTSDFILQQPERMQPPVFHMHSEIEQLGSLAMWAAGNGLPARGVVPAGAIIVVGDNSKESRDSRSFGFVPVQYIMGTISNGQNHE